MKIVGLISGGKDSIYNMLQCIAAGHEIVAVANIEPESKDEIDSYMFQSVGHEAISLISSCLGLPIFRHRTKGHAFCKSKVYERTSKDEVEDLFELITEVKKNKDIDGVSVGAIASDYQRTRVENVCSRLNLRCFAYLWKRDQEELLEEMISAQMDAIVIKVACMGLNPNVHLGMHIKDLMPHLLNLKEKFGVNVCGEGGEYETLTLDCPLYNRLIKITESNITLLSNDAFAPVGYLYIKKATIESKNSDSSDPLVYFLNNIKVIRSIVKKPFDYIQDCLDEVSENMVSYNSKTQSNQDLPFPFEAEENEKMSGKLMDDFNRDVCVSKSQLFANPSAILLLNETPKCHVSGTTGWCYIGNIIGSTFVDAFQCLQKQLERNNYEFQDAVFVCVYVREMSEFSKMNKVYSHYMPNILPPARICVESDLPPKISIIMSVVAHRIVSKTQKLLKTVPVSERDALHVRSISHWAPANIGPYSQCIGMSGIYYVAGQIPLVPGTMEILNRPAFNQCKLTLRHVSRILDAMDESLNFSHVLQAVCYVTSKNIASDIVGFWNYITNATHCTIAVIVVSMLPKNAPLEWEVIACKSVNPEVKEKVESMDDFVAHMKRCAFEDVFASSLVCKFRYTKKAQKKDAKLFTLQGLITVLNSCLKFLKGDTKTSSPLTMVRLFYKSSDVGVASIVNNLFNSFMDSKVVMTIIPVSGFETSDVFIIFTGVCH